MINAAPGAAQASGTSAASATRTAVGLASANLDTQFSGIAAAVWAYVVEGTTTAVQAMRGMLSALLGKLSGAATTTVA